MAEIYIVLFYQLRTRQPRFSHATFTLVVVSYDTCCRAALGETDVWLPICTQQLPQTTMERSRVPTGVIVGEECKWKFGRFASVQVSENFMTYSSQQRIWELIFTLADSSFLAGSSSDILCSLICAVCLLLFFNSQSTKENKNLLYLHPPWHRHKQSRIVELT